MKTFSISALVAVTIAVPAFAENLPIFAAECAGGVNNGGYNIDTDPGGFLWVNGHRVALQAFGATGWEGGYHGVTFSIDSGENAPVVMYTGRHGVNGICTIVSM